MTLSRQIIAGVALTLAAVAAQAEAAPAAAAAPPAGWTGKGEAGIVFARGNTEADTVNLKLGMSHEVDRWKHSLEMAALRATNKGVKSADRYMAGWQSDYKINARTFAFGALRYERDKLSAFDYQASLSAGLGYKFYDTDTIKLSGQAGVGYRRLKEALPPGKTYGDAVFVAGMDYENKLTASTKVVDKFRAEVGSKNTLLANFLGIEVKMSDALALSVGFDVRDNTKAVSPAKKFDTVTTVNLVYAF
jgi:putative salt-induced outer membrane protein